ncbi:hypothetical protein [Vallitalea okinawensis]|uniref:hypothetical protein n=1 Tax=Vallitalea okinawensis TaxID=2078660 RepID=UPI000CFDBC07|nr:hypothetical protein [Vallitalea okinawensis]
MANLDSTKVYGDLDIKGRIICNGNEINSDGIDVHNHIYGDGKEAIRMHDSLLRLNDTNAFTSGIYCGTGIFRTDGCLQVGSAGDAFTFNNNTDKRIYIENTKQPKITVSTSAPLSPQTNDIWFEI